MNPLWFRLATASGPWPRVRLAGPEAEVDAEASRPAAPGPWFDFARIPIMPPPIQRKEAVSSPEDPHEREADEVADEVTRMAEMAPVAVQRKCSTCEEEDRNQLMRAPSSAGAIPGTGAAVHAASRGGEPFPASARARFEPRFGRDFAGVRIHRDGEAAEAARSVQARAYTWGRDIVFGRDEYQPDTPTGARLLAHELAHVVQQDGGARRLSRQQTPGAPGDAKAPAPAAPTAPEVVTLPDQADTALGPECRADETSNPIPADSVQKDPSYLRRDLTPAEHAYVNALEDKRVSMSLTALQKLVQLRQDIITGNPDLQLHPEGKRKESDMPKPTGDAEQDAKVRQEIQEKDFARRTAIKDLNLRSFFTTGAINWNWVGDEAAAKALEQIAQAEKLIQAQASKRLPRVVLPYLLRGTLAQKILAEQRLGFNPCFFVAKGYNDQRCWTWILMHEYFHSLGIYHGQIVPSKSATHPEWSPERALTDVDYLTRLVMELALGSPFTTDCHAADA